MGSVEEISDNSVEEIHSKGEICNNEKNYITPKHTILKHEESSNPVKILQKDENAVIKCIDLTQNSSPKISGSTFPRKPAVNIRCSYSTNLDGTHASLNSDQSREDKEEFVKRRMNEMRLKNEKIMQRYAEVEQDRRKAEEENSAVIITKANSKRDIDEEKSKEYSREWDKNKLSYDKTSSRAAESKTFHTREWDKGKLPAELWDSEYHEIEYNKSYKLSHERNYDKKESNKKRNFTRTEVERSREYKNMPNDRDIKYGKSNRHFENNKHITSYDTAHSYKSPRQSKPIKYSTESHHKTYSSHSNEKYESHNYNSSKKRFREPYRSSQFKSDSKNVGYLSVDSIKASLWQSDKLKENENKQIRLQSWLETTAKVNKNDVGDEEFRKKEPNLKTNKTEYHSHEINNDKKTQKRYTKFDRFDRSDHSSDESVSNDYQSPKKQNLNNSNSTSNNEVRKEKEYSTSMYSSLKNNCRSNKPSPQNDLIEKGNSEFRRQRKSESNSETSFKSNTKKLAGGNRCDDHQSFKSKPKYSSSHINSSKQIEPTDDGLWGNADQSDIQWKLSGDEEPETPDWVRAECSTYHQLNTYSNTYNTDNWGESNWTDNYSSGQDLTKQNIPDGWEEYEAANVQMQFIHPNKDKNWFSEETAVSSCTEFASESLKNTNLPILNPSLQKYIDISTDSVVSIFRDSLCISSKHNIYKEKANCEKMNLSDDGDWSTVSEDEINSDYENKYGQMEINNSVMK